MSDASGAGHLLNYEMIAKDEIAVIVNAKNPLENITVEQLEAIYTGKTVKWEEVQWEDFCCES